jgi:hypothetical protein
MEVFMSDAYNHGLYGTRSPGYGWSLSETQAYQAGLSTRIANNQAAATPIKVGLDSDQRRRLKDEIEERFPSYRRNEYSAPTRPLTYPPFCSSRMPFNTAAIWRVAAVVAVAATIAVGAILENPKLLQSTGLLHALAPEQYRQAQRDEIRNYLIEKALERVPSLRP